MIWTGTIEVPQSGLQEIATYSDDGARLWVGGQLVVDAWEDQSGTRNIGLYDFTAGERVPIRMEYYENGGEATARPFCMQLGAAKGEQIGTANGTELWVGF